MLRKLIDIQYERNDTLLGRGRFRVQGDVVEVQPAYEETGVPHRVLRRRGRGDHALRPADRRGARRSTTRSPSSRRRSTSRRSRRSSARSTRSARAGRAGQAVRGGGQAARGAPPPAAHRVRPRDDAGARLLLRDRELLAHPRRPRRRARRRTRCSTTSRRTSSSSSTSRTRRCRRSAACTRATARARRRSSTSASACRRRSTTGRCGSTSSSRRCRRSCSSRRRRAPYELRHATRVVEQLIRPTGLVDPEVELRPTKNQIDDLLDEIRQREAGRRARARHDADEEDGRGPDRLPARVGRQGALPPLRDRHARADPDHPRAAARRVRRARRRQPAARGARPAGGVARRDPRRRQGGLPARRDVADPDDRPRGAQRQRQGAHVRRQA